MTFGLFRHTYMPSIYSYIYCICTDIVYQRARKRKRWEHRIHTPGTNKGIIQRYPLSWDFFLIYFWGEACQRRSSRFDLPMPELPVGRESYFKRQQVTLNKSTCSTYPYFFFFLFFFFFFFFFLLSSFSFFPPSSPLLQYTKLGNERDLRDFISHH